MTVCQSHTYSDLQNRTKTLRGKVKNTPRPDVLTLRAVTIRRGVPFLVLFLDVFGIRRLV